MQSHLSATRLTARHYVTAALACVLLATPVLAQEQPTPDTGSAAMASAPAFDVNEPAPQLPQLAEGILISVNNDMITSYDLKQRMLLVIITSGVQVTQENYDAIQQQALNSLVNERLQMQELNFWKVKISDEEIDTEIARMAGQSNLTAEQLLGELKKVGIEPGTLRDQIRAETGWGMLVGGRYASSAKVGQAQVDATMDRIITDGQKPQYLVAEIYLDFAQAGGRDNALRGAKQLHDQIAARVAPFQAVARQFSNSPSAAQGGDAGWLVAGSIDPAIDAALSAVKPGEMTPPIETKDGVYIYLLRQKTDGNADLVMRLKQAAITLPAGASAADVASAQQSLLSFRSRTGECGTLDPALSTSQIRITDLGDVALSTLKPDYAAALRTLKENQATQPLRTAQTVNVFYVCGRRLAGDNALTRTQVESQLVNQRLAMLGKRYLRELRSAATIENH